MKTLTQIISPIADELQQFEAYFGQTLKAETEPMDSIMRYVLDTRGKRLRPILALLSAKLFGVINGQTLRAATFVEMVHSATLIHDDVVDNDDQRRGRASVKARFGNLSAVLAGDFLLAKAMLLLSHPDDHAILEVMLRTTAAMSEGELMQGSVGLSYHGSRNDKNNGCRNDKNNGCHDGKNNGCHDVTALQSQYLEIITNKTAMLMQSCCTAGALSVDASTEQIRQIEDFGLNFGILFQLRDDMLDGENEEIAEALLPIYHEKALKALESFPPSEAKETLRNLTFFCFGRTE